MLEKPVFQLDKLQIWFKRGRHWSQTVFDAGFDLHAGQTLGVVGESGSGKSVTALAMMRLLPENISKLSAAKMTLEGTDILSLDPEPLRNLRGNRISMIFQEPMTSLNPVFTCGFQVAEAIRAHRSAVSDEAREISIELFRKVHLPRPERMFDSYPHQISGGQKQRVMIAMAIANNPSVLIADEPTTALDVTVQKEILELLQQLQAENGMAMVFISHDLGVVGRLADHIAVMQQGHMVEYGMALQILEAPSHSYTRSLLACRPPRDIRLTRLPVVAEFTGGKWPGGLPQVRQELMAAPEERKIRHHNLFAQHPLLEVEKLKVWFPQPKKIFSSKREVVKAVDDISFTVYPGETLGLVGESGCGKTTLGRAILRLQTATGKVIFDGQEVNTLNSDALRKLRKKMQIVFQDPYSSLNPRMTIGSAIEEPMIVHRLHGNSHNRREKVMELLEKTGLEKAHFNRYPHEFSGGQRQRICIARALAVEPSLLVCDESVSALDVSVQAQVLNLLNELKKEFGLTYIFISHDLSVVRYMSDRVMVMKDGRLVELAEADSLYTNPQQSYTRALIDAIP